MSHDTLTLRSDDPPLTVEFELRRGSSARIGAAADAEVRLPLTGLADHACTIGRAEDGRFYLADGSGGAPRFVSLPAVVPLGSYQFVAFQQVVSAPAVRHAEAPVASARRAERRGMSPAAICAISAGVVAAAGAAAAVVVMWAGKPTSSVRQAVIVAAADRPAGQTTPPPPPVGEPPATPVKQAQAASPSAPTPSPAPAPGPSPAPATTAGKRPKQLPSDAELKAFAARTSGAYGQVITKTRLERDLTSATGVVVSESGLVLTSLDYERLGISTVFVTADGKEHKLQGPVATDEEAGLVLYQTDLKGLPHLELGESLSLVAGDPVLLAVDGGDPEAGYLRSEVTAERGLPPAARRGMPNKGDLLVFPTKRQRTDFGAPVLDAGLRVIGLLCYRNARQSAYSGDMAVPVETIAALLERHRAGKGLPVPEQRKPDPVLDDPDYVTLRNFVLDGVFDKAVDLGRKMVARYPDSPDVRTHLANGLIGQEKFDEAEKVIRAGLVHTPEDWVLWCKLGEVLHSTKKTGEARKAWEKSTELNPDAVGAWYWLAVSRLLAEEFQQAIPPLEEMKRLDPAIFGSIIGQLRKELPEKPRIRVILDHFGKDAEKQ